ncbi:MAG: hypothetical protein GYA78_00200 [Caldisericales bacterium]|jgi:hypothetical protein|nr:hypothetical protein [Caldisericales bacterium]
MDLNLKNLLKLVEKDLPKALEPKIQKLVEEKLETQRDEVAAEMEEMMEERESLLGRNCPPLQRKTCHLEARDEFIIEFRKKGYLSEKFYQSKDWLSIARPVRKKLP